MRFGKMYRFGDVILAQMQFVDTFEIKTRPAMVIFEEQGNIVIAGITSNTDMQGVILTKEEGAVKKSIIKMNYVFTVSEKMIKKKLFSLSQEKKQKVKEELIKRLV